MKTKEEIKSWLFSQTWFPSFVLNTIEDGTNGNGIRQLLNGERGRNTLLEAFTWGSTEEGKEFWNAKNDEFNKWYYETEFKNIAIGEMFKDEKGKTMVKVSEYCAKKIIVEEGAYLYAADSKVSQKILSNEE